MTSSTLLDDQRRYLAELLEAVQRCVYFLDASSSALPWPLTGDYLRNKKKDNNLFEALAAVNERFAKLQDFLGPAMKHSLVLSGEHADTFMQVLVLFDKLGVLASVDSWQLARTARNLAAHDYETDYDQVANHFNGLHALKPELFGVAKRFASASGTRLASSGCNKYFCPRFA